MAHKGQIFSQTTRELSEAITRLYIANPADARARWLYERWGAFLDSAVYNTTPDTALYPVYQAFATGLFVARKVVPNVPPSTDVEVSLQRIVLGDINQGFDVVSRATDKAIDSLAETSRKVAMGALPLIALLSIPVLGGIAFYLAKNTHRTRVYA